MPRFQKRHYTAIAEIISACSEDQATLFFADLPRFVHKLVTLFERDNPRFDSARFLAACKLTPSTVHTQQRSQ